MTQRFCLYNGIQDGRLAIPVSTHDTPEEAADAARATVLANIARMPTVGDPMECAVLVIPVPLWRTNPVPPTKETP